jgi:hypothetical protein
MQINSPLVYGQVRPGGVGKSFLGCAHGLLDFLCATARHLSQGLARSRVHCLKGGAVSGG